MSSSGAHLAEICIHSSPDISTLVISQKGDTVLSRYGDNIWELSPYLPARNVKQRSIRFDTELIDGRKLTDLIYADLLDAAKRFLYARWRVRAPHSRKYVAAKTVLNNWTQLRRLLKWMVGKGITSFNQLNSKYCLEYAASLKGELQPSSMVISLQVLTIYYDLRDHLIDRLPEYPWKNSAPSVLARQRGVQKNGHGRQAATEPIPPRILRLLVQAALNYVENCADRLLSVADEVRRIQSTKKISLNISHRERYPNKFSSVYDSEEEYLAVRLSHICSSEISALCRVQGLTSFKHFKSELLHLRTACYIICAAFSGMRDSELASLEVGCFSTRKGFDGEIFSWLKGTTYKLEKDPAPAEWMVPDIVGKAIAVATRLGAAQREKCLERIAELDRLLANNRLHPAARRKAFIELAEMSKHKNALMFVEHENGKITSLSGATAISSLRKFGAMVGIAVEQADLAGSVNHTKICVGNPWPFSPHQFRRTFAVFVARNLMGDVRYLREHFKHWSIDMTLYYAKHDASVDETVFHDVLSERDELQAIIMEKWLATDTTLSGGGGKRILSFRDRSEVKTVKDMRDFCRKLGDDVYIRGTGHSWCMASGNGCGGQGLYDAVRCNSCGEGVIDDSHLKIWQGIRLQQIEVLQCPDIGLPAWQRCVSHLREAERVLVDLGEKIEPYSVTAPES